MTILLLDIEKCQICLSKYFFANYDVEGFSSLYLFIYFLFCIQLQLYGIKYFIQMHRYFYYAIISYMLMFISLPSNIFIEIYFFYFTNKLFFSYYIYTTVQKLNVFKSLKIFNVFEQRLLMFLW